MRKAQVAMEYLLIMAFIMIVIIPGIYLFYNYSEKSTEKLVYSQVEQIAHQIIDNAENVYYTGEPSFTTITVKMPENIKEISIQNNKELVFKIVDSDQVYLSDVNLSGEFGNTSWSAGLKKIKVQAFDNYVNISFT